MKTTKSTFAQRNVKSLINQFDDNVKNLIGCFEDMETILSAVNILNGTGLAEEELPQIPDNDIAEDVNIVSLNALSGYIRIKFIRKIVRKWNGNGYDLKTLENPEPAFDTIHYNRYMEFAVNGMFYGE